MQRQIPERLSHYTSLESLKSILSDDDGNGICFWAFSNKCKNDDQEIRMGEYMLNRVKAALPSKSSLLYEFSGYENTASVSFMEGDVNQHMLDVYGRYRLEFDLRALGIGILTGGLVDCEYVSENDLKEYADEYCEMISSTLRSIPILQKKYGKKSVRSLNPVIDFLMMEQDIMTKVLCLKEQKWSPEKEWRIVFEFKDDSEKCFYNGKPFIKYYLDKSALTDITVFCSPGIFDWTEEDNDELEKYISEKGYNVKVRKEVV